MHKCYFAECTAAFNTFEGLCYHMKEVHDVEPVVLGATLAEQIERGYDFSTADQLEFMEDMNGVWYGVIT